MEGNIDLTTGSHLSNRLFCFGCLTVEVCMDKYIRKIITALGHHFEPTQGGTIEDMIAMICLPAIVPVVLAIFVCKTLAGLLQLIETNTHPLVSQRLASECSVQAENTFLLYGSTRVTCRNTL